MTDNIPPANANAECVGPSSASAGKAASCAGCPNQSVCAAGGPTPEALAAQATETAQLQMALRGVSHVVLVVSGKGGVGKSTLATQLALTLAEREQYAVGLLDVDLCGPSVPRMVLGGGGDQATNTPDITIHKNAAGLWIPVYTPGNVAVMSLQFLLPPRDANQAVIWRGPRKNALISQFLTQVDWSGPTGEGLDYLIIDTPPGTSDEHISTVQLLQKAAATTLGAIVVTTPEAVALADVRKELSFCQKTKVPVYGIVENMGTLETTLADWTFCKDGVDCTAHVRQLLQQHCPELLTPQYTAAAPLLQMHDDSENSEDGVSQMARDFGCPVWARIPLDRLLLRACDTGQCLALEHPGRPAAQAIVHVCRQLVARCPVEMNDD